MKRLKSDVLMMEALHAVAEECLSGVHLNGRDRLRNLRARGYSEQQITTIQKIVNKKIAKNKEG